MIFSRSFSNALFFLASRRFASKAFQIRAVLALLVALSLSAVIALHNTAAQSGAFVSTFAGASTAGRQDGQGTNARFNSPIGLAIDANDNLIVADFHNGQIRKIDPQRNVTTLAGSTPGFLNGTATTARFYGPAGVAIDRNGNIIVADYGNNRIRQISPSGQVTTLAGSGVYGSLDGAALNARFAKPSGVAVDAAGNIYVADAGTHLIRKISVDRYVSVFAGSVQGFADGQGKNAKFDFYGGAPQICTDANGNLIVADFGNRRIRRITPDGTVTTISGNNDSFTNDGPLNVAGFFYPTGVTADRQGNIIVGGWHDSRIRKIDLVAQMVTTIAGSGEEGHLDSPATTAQFVRPAGVAVDSRGNIYAADYYDNCIRRVSVSGAPLPTPTVSPTPTPTVTPTPTPTVTPTPTPTPVPTPTPTPVPTPTPTPGAGEILNPGFETGNWDGWTLNSITINGGPFIVTDASLVTEGQYALQFTARGRRLYDYGIQTVNLAPGNYIVSCDTKVSLGTATALGVINGDGSQGPYVTLPASTSGKLVLDFNVPEGSKPIQIFFLGSQNRYVRSWAVVDNLVLVKK